MSPHIGKAAAQCVAALNRCLQIAFVAGAAFLTALANDFQYMPVLSIGEAVMLVLLIGLGPMLFIRAWHEQPHLEQSVIRYGVNLLALIGLLYGWVRHQPDLLVASAILALQLIGMRFYDRRARSRARK